MFIMAYTEVFYPTLLASTENVSEMVDGELGFCVANKKIYLKTHGNAPTVYGGSGDGSNAALEWTII